MRTIFSSLPRLFLLLTVFCLVIFVNGLATESPSLASINGNLRKIGNQQILDLWGSNYEMGYAHGYLMADQIRNLIDKYAVGEILGGGISNYTNFVNNLERYIVFYPQYLDEINGIVAGIIASGKNLYVPILQRNIDARDIEVWNCFPELYYSCSSFGVWGNATTNGETILGRNMDWDDSHNNLSDSQILITYEPTGGQKFVSISWPGWIGVISGLNENGISLMINMGFGGLSSSAGPFHPSIEVMRNILENTTPVNYLTQPLSIVNSVEEYSTFNIQIAAANNGYSNPVYYIEDSSDQNVIRYSTDSDPNYNHIIATNHFMKVSPPPSSGDSIERYNTLRNGLISLYGTGDGKVDSTEAFSLLGSVTRNTLTSIVIRPNRMEFDVSFASWSKGYLERATELQPQTYSWANLFPNHGPAPLLPDLIVQSINIDPALPVWGQPATVTATVKNQGNADSGSYQVDFYNNLTSAPTPQQIGDSSLNKGSLAAGATDTCVFTVTYPISGNYNAWVQVDTEQQVIELNETNNVLSTSITSTNTPPVAVNDTYSTTSDKALNIASPGVLTNDTDANGDAMTASLVSGVGHGTLTLNNDGSFSYNPTTGYTGSDSFTYRAYDGKDYSSNAIVSITVTSTNTPPVDSHAGDFIGINYYDATAGLWNNELDAVRFQNNAGTGTMTNLSINVFIPNTLIRLGVYSDNSGSPGSLLLDAGEIRVHAGWNVIRGLNLGVTSGTYYWLAFNTPEICELFYWSGGPSNCHAYKSKVTYGALPSTFGTPTGYDTNRYVMRGFVDINSSWGGAYSKDFQLGVSPPTNSQYHAIDNPPDVETGDLLITAFSVDGNPTCSASPGFGKKKAMTYPAADLPGVVDPNGYIYCIGGYGADEWTYLNYNQRYNPSTNTWSQMAKMPTARWGPAAAYYNGKIYVFGGATSGGASNKCEIYNINGNNWTTGTNIPVALDHGVMAVTVGSYIYIFRSTTVYQYDPAGNGGLGSYTAKTSAPVQKKWACCAYVKVGGEDRIYIIGGSNDADTPLTSNYYYRPTNNDWSSAQAAAPYAAHGVLRDNPTYGGYIYFGYGWNPSTGDFHDEIYQYNPSANTWSGIKAKSYFSRDGIACGMVSGKLYCMGGRESSGNPYGIDYNEVYDTSETNNWIKLGQSSSSTTVTGAIFYKVADGYDGLTVYTSTAEQSSHVVYRIKNASGVVTGASAYGSSTNTNPPSLDAGSSQAYLWIVTRHGASGVAPSAPPTSYIAFNTVLGRSSGITTSTAERRYEVQSEDPGAFTSDAAAWVSYTIAVSPLNEPPTSLPDLIVQSINIDPALPVWGQPATVTATVKNQGNADSGSYQVDFYNNLTSAPTPQQIGDSSLNKGSLAAGATDTCVFTVTYPISGNYNAWVQVDTEQQVIELNETNNVLSTSITSTNTPPVALNDTYSTTSDKALNIASPGVLTNDTDANGDAMTASLVSGVGHGTLTLNNDGSFIYSPTTGYTGSDSFTYRAYDGKDYSSNAIVSITVTSTNTPPVAVNDTYSTTRNKVLNIASPGVLTNDTDANGDAMTASLVSGVGHGTLTLNNDGSFSYNPTTGYTGSDSFTYRAYDGKDYSSNAIVSITINNTAPVAVNDTYSTTMNKGLNIASPGVLTNDTDANGDAMTASLVSGVGHGTLTLNSNGSFIFSPTTGYSGSDSFTYRAYDGKDYSNNAIVSITITSTNTPPVAVNDAYNVNEDNPLSIVAPGVLGNDTDADNNPLTAIKVTNPSHGTVNFSANGAFTYTPNVNYNGPDSFTYRANDGKARSNIATVSIIVNAVNDTPVAVNDTYSVVAGTTLTVAASGVLANDTDADGDQLTVVPGSGVSHGSLTLNGNGSFTYTPVSGYTGNDSFTYMASDGKTNSAIATVSITITASIATFGLNNGNGTSNESLNYMNAMRFQNTAGTGTLTKLELLFDDTTPNGRVRLGVYADNNGVPGSLLRDAGDVIVTNGWVSISGLSLPVTQNTYYWLAFDLQSPNGVRYQTGRPSNSRRRVLVNFGPLPSQYPGTSSSSNSQFVMRATVTANPAP